MWLVAVIGSRSRLAPLRHALRQKLLLILEGLTCDMGRCRVAKHAAHLPGLQRCRARVVARGGQRPRGDSCAQHVSMSATLRKTECWVGSLGCVVLWPRHAGNTNATTRHDTHCVVVSGHAMAAACIGSGGHCARRASRPPSIARLSARLVEWVVATPCHAMPRHHRSCTISWTTVH